MDESIFEKRKAEEQERFDKLLLCAKKMHINYTVNLVKL